MAVNFWDRVRTEIHLVQQWGTLSLVTRWQVVHRGLIEIWMGTFKTVLTNMFYIHLFTFWQQSCFLETTTPHYGISWWCFPHVCLFLFFPFYTPILLLFKHGHDFNPKTFEDLDRDEGITSKPQFPFSSLASFSPLAVSGQLSQWIAPRLLSALLGTASWFHGSRSVVFSMVLAWMALETRTTLTVGLHLVARRCSALQLVYTAITEHRLLNWVVMFLFLKGAIIKK